MAGIVKDYRRLVIPDCRKAASSESISTGDDREFRALVALAR